jgi:hypothetical protein
MKFVGKFRKSPKQKQVDALFKEWDRQRALAATYGSSHMNEIDAIFSRHLAEIEKIPTK